MRFDLREAFPPHDEEAPRQIDHARAALVRARRDAREAAPGRRRAHLERVATPSRRTLRRQEGDSSGLRAPVAELRRDEEADGTYEKDGVDQLKRVLHDIKENPNSRRLLVTGWNPKEADQVALPPCHTLFSSTCRRRAVLSALSAQRGRVLASFNIASYAMLTMMMPT